MNKNTTTANLREISHFSEIADSWWEKDSPFSALHTMNPVRLSFIYDSVRTHFNLRMTSKKLMTGLHVLDVGCGGGVLCEPLAMSGATVTGIDASEKAVSVAKEHAKASKHKIEYYQSTVEQWSEQHFGKYDIVTALEIIEHVDNVDIFINKLSQLVKPGGILFLSTMNRTIKSYLLGILFVENVTGWVPKHTHDWHKLIKPSEINDLCIKSGLSPFRISGMGYHPLKKEFSLTPHNLDINYIFCAIKDFHEK